MAFKAGRGAKLTGRLQPTCDDTHAVIRFSAGISTDSTTRPSCSVTAFLIVPSEAALHVVYLNVVDGKMRFEHVARDLRKGWSSGRNLGRLVPEPLINLLGTERFLAVLCKELFQLIELQFADITFGGCADHNCKVTQDNPIRRILIQP